MIFKKKTITQILVGPMSGYSIYLGEKTDLGELKKSLVKFEKIQTLEKNGSLKDFKDHFKFDAREDCLSFTYIHYRQRKMKGDELDDDGNLDVKEYQTVVNHHTHCIVYDYGSQTVFLIEDNSKTSCVAARNQIQKILSSKAPYEIKRTGIPQSAFERLIKKAKESKNPKFPEVTMTSVEYKGQYTSLEPNGKMITDPLYSNHKDYLKIDLTNMEGMSYTLSDQGAVKVSSRMKDANLMDIERLIRNEIIQDVYAP